MSSRIPHKTLAKTLIYVAYRYPDEYGLFWDPSGTMPWKEFQWALHQDPKLRFVRESTIKELELLGFKLPFTVRDGLLTIHSGTALPCPAPCRPPSRLHHHVRRKQFRAVRRQGLTPLGRRTYVPLCTTPALSEKIASRRDPQAIAVQVTAEDAWRGGIEFLQAGPELFLATGIPVEFLVLPALSEERLEAVAPRRKREVKKTVGPSPPLPPGSFYVDPAHLKAAGPAGEASDPKEGKKGKGNRGKDGWKRRARKERRKRQV